MLGVLRVKKVGGGEQLQFQSCVMGTDNEAQAVTMGLCGRGRPEDKSMGRR